MPKKETKELLVYIIIAYLFSLAVRYLYVWQVGNDPSLYWNGQIMINTNDGYYWAEGARDILSGVKAHYLSPVNLAASQITALLVKILPFSFETIIFYMSGFLASLVVIPIILIGKSFGNIKMGFITALFASIAWSYYNRTMFGYYDTDMLNIVLPTILLWSLIWALWTNENKYLLIIGLDILIYRWWYPSSYSLEFSFWGMIFLYTLYKFYKKEDISYNLYILTFMLIAMSYLDIYIRSIALIILYAALYFKEEIFKKYQYYIFSLALIVFSVTGGLAPIVNQLKLYVFRSSISIANDEVAKLHYYSTMQTVREAGKIPFKTLANRISGNILLLFISIIGYILLLFRHRVMMLSIPMVILGLLAYKGGLRFTIYAIVPLAFGLSFLIFELSKYIENKNLRRLFVVISAIAILYPNVKHSYNYNKYMKSVFNKSEVEDLDKLKNISKKDDFVLTWWDYGYPIRYYAYVNTLIDGSKHSHDNFIISKLMQSNSPMLAANLSRLSIETYVEDLKKLEKLKDNNLTEYKKSYKILSKAFDGVIYKYKTDPNEFLLNLENRDFKLPKKSRDIYFYMPYRMVNIFSTVMLFGNLDLTIGKALRDTLFYPGYYRGKRGDKIILSNGLVFDSKKGIIYFGRKAVKVKIFVEAKVDNRGNTKLLPMIYHKNGSLALIYLPHRYQFIVMDLKTFESNYVQMGLLGKYNKDLFELVVQSPYSRIYKVKK